MIKDPIVGMELFPGITGIILVISNEIKINIVPKQKHNIVIKYATYYCELCA